MNFAKNTVCLQCDAKRPKRQLLPGEWECPQYVLVLFFQLCMIYVLVHYYFAALELLTQQRVHNPCAS